MTVCALSNTTYALALCAALILGVLLVLYGRAVKAAFSANRLLQTYLWIVESGRNKATQYIKLDAQLKNLPTSKMDSAQLTKWSENLAFAVLFNRSCLFAAKKLHLLHTQAYLVASSAVVVIFLLGATTLAFASANYALYKAYPSSFEVSATPSFFTFIFYSFNTFVFNFVREVVPTAPASHTLWMIEAVCGIALVVIFAAQILTYRFQKHTDQLSQTAAAIEREGNLFEDHVSKEWQLPSIDAAMKELERAKSGLLTILVWLTQNSK